MLRSAVKEGTEFGRKAKEIMDRGELVSDEIMGGVVDERLRSDDTHNRGYILDGFPRTVGQAELLAKITEERPLDLVIEIGRASCRERVVMSVVDVSCMINIDG